MSTGLIDIMKRASLDAMEANQPADLRFGTVVSVTPLKVQVTNQFSIPQSLLIVPEHLTDYEIELSFENASAKQPVTLSTPDGTMFFSGNTTFDYPIKHKIKIYGALKVNDRVALLRKQGGQSYFILDRI